LKQPVSASRITASFLAAIAAFFLTAAVFAGSALAAASSNSEFYIRGGGFGHDIGMSQYGAAGYAQHGWKYGAILSHYYSHTTVSKLGSTKYVTVLIAQGPAPSFSGATSVSGTKVKLRAGTHYTVRTAGRRLELTTGGKAVRSGGRVVTFGTPLTVTAPKMVNFIGHGNYRDSLQFRFGTSGNGCTNGGRIATINRVGLNDYVRGVVTEEMPYTWPAQALDVQAIASRTYAITAGSANPGRWMLYGDTCSEAYKGVAGETSASNKAVNATYNRVVEYHGTPAFTPYFSSSGGHTKSLEFSWGSTNDPWLVGVSDPYDGAFGNPNHHWGYNVSISKIQGQLSGAGYLKGSLRSIRVNTNNVQVVGSGGTTTLDGLDLEDLFGTLSPNMTYTTMWDHAGKVGSSKLGIAGTILPATNHARVTAQLRSGSTWKAVNGGYTNAAGAFSMPLKKGGRYRIVYHNIDGPGVNVGS
jgi:stage II sporulation protein D